jgi:hypothetical protein
MGAGNTIGVLFRFWAVTISVIPLVRQMVPSTGRLSPCAAIALHHCGQWVRPNASSNPSDVPQRALYV